jgi:formate hydrogenlyase subunit 3/multisubunit Na+/H+ antiporter MnhD subunit
MNPLVYPVILPFICGLILLFFSKKFQNTLHTMAFIGSLITFLLTVYIFLFKYYTLPLFNYLDPHQPLAIWFGIDLPVNIYLKLDGLSRFIILAIGFFGFLIVLYSGKFTSAVVSNYFNLKSYYLSILWTIGAFFSWFSGDFWDVPCIF